MTIRTFNEGITNATRPSTLEDVVGMEYNKRIIRYDIQGAMNLGEPLPSYLVVGPAGTGKTTLATIIASLSKRADGKQAEIYKTLGTEIRSEEDIYTIASKVEDGDIVYIEEAHTIGGSGPKSKLCQAVLLEWIENFKILGGEDLNLVSAPKVSFVLPTTNPGRLSQSLRNRCKVLHTAYYSVEELKQILNLAGRKFNLDLSSDDQALTLLAQSSRGTPRIAIMHRLDMLRKVMSVESLEYNLDTVKLCLRINNVNHWGLEYNDIKYCNVLYEKMLEVGGKPVGRKTMEQVMGLAPDMLDHMIESYLQQIGILAINHRGRFLTEFGYRMIGKEPINIEPLQSVKRKSIDLDVLKELIKDDNLCKMGMKGLMPKFNLRYGKDNAIMQDALRQIGYIAKKKIGIQQLIVDTEIDDNGGLNDDE